MSLSRANHGKFLEILKGLDLKEDTTRIKRQLYAADKIKTLQDKHSPYQADFIIHTTERLERRAGSLLGIKAYYQTPEALVLAKLRTIKVSLPSERTLKDKEDVRAIIRNTRVDKRKIVRAAKRDTTLTIFRETLHKPVRVRAGRSRWGKEAFPDAGEATFGD